MEVELLQKRIAAIHPLFGDRSNELTLIGLPEACKRFAASLERALCTEEEIVSWQRRESFVDPWPQSIQMIRWVAPLFQAVRPTPP